MLTTPEDYIYYKCNATDLKPQQNSAVETKLVSIFGNVEIPFISMEVCSNIQALLLL